LFIFSYVFESFLVSCRLQSSHAIIAHLLRWHSHVFAINPAHPDAMCAGNLFAMISADLTPVFQEIARLDVAAAHTQVDRKEAGITYTPPHIVREMVNLLDPQWDQTIHEPSCGRGMFVFGLVEYWLGQGKSASAIARWAAEHLFVCDTDESAVADLHKIWRVFFQRQGVDHAPLNALVSDGLHGTYSDWRFDIIVGNPPYVRIQHLDPDTRHALRQQFSSCRKGNVDLYYAFLEDALNRARRVCYITPNSWFSNRSALALRKLAKPRLSKIVDFGTHLVFAPVRAYTAISLFDTTDAKDPHIQVADAQGRWVEVNRDDARWDDALWTPLQEADISDNETLSSKVDVISGIATLADKAFTLPNPRVLTVDGQTFVEQVDPDFPEFTLCVPVEMAPRLIKATKPGQLGMEGPRILCPYDEHWKIIKEEDLRSVAPDLLAWLERRRKTLDNRDKGKTEGYEAWYAYGRRQGFWNAQKSETVVVVPVMGNGRLEGQTTDTANTGGRFLFTSGYVLKPKAGVDAIEVANHIKSANAWTHVQRTGKGWAGKGEYRTIGARSLRQMPWGEH
jgi:hypothetical protein